MNRIFSAVAIATSVIVVSQARGDLASWEAAAIDDGAGFTQLNVTSPTLADIGIYDDDTNGGVTYEFITNATGFSLSNALMGANFVTPQSTFVGAAGDNAAIKFNQFRATGRYGATISGPGGTDFNSGIAATLNEDVTLAFVADGADMDLYVGGTFQSNMPGASIALSGVVGLGQVHLPNLGVLVADLFQGEILGTAVYDHALSASDILEHHNTFSVPEPTSMLSICIIGIVGIATRPGNRK